MNVRAWASADRTSLFDALPCSIVVIDRDYTIVDHNPGFVEVWGSSLGAKCFAQTRGRSRRCQSCPAELTFRDGERRVLEQNGVDRNGRPVHSLVHVTPVHDATGAVSHVAVISTDLTATRRLQSEYQTLFEQVPCYVAVLNREYRVVKANRMFRKVFGEPTGEHCYTLLKHRQRKCDDCPAERTFADGAAHVSRHVGVSRTGEEAPYMVSTAALVPGDGGPSHVIEMALDLSEVTRLEHEKLEAERLAAVGQTVAGLAHGIKNILTGLEGGMYVTSTGLNRSDPQRTRQGWEMLERNIGRISALVKNLLAFSRGDGPKLATIDPREVIGEIHALFSDSAAQHGVELVIADEAPGIEPVVMDREGLRSCLENLVSNALDACLVSGSAPCTITLRLRERERTVMFEVSDSGCGMDYEVKQKVFTSFFSTKGAGGTGLGLLLTRKIVQQHGGTITFESTPGRGTTFRLSFPRDRLPRPVDAGNAPRRGDGGEPSRRPA
jgi:signal transduction histidine kinase